MSRKIVNVDNKPWVKTVEFSLGVISTGALLHTAGITARDPQGNIVGVGDIRVQIQQCFDNLHDVLRAAGCDWADVIKFTLYTTDMPAFVRHRDLWGTFYVDSPASTLIGVKDLIHPDMMVEIEAIAKVKT